MLGGDDDVHARPRLFLVVCRPRIFQLREGVVHFLDGAVEAGFHRFLALWRRVAYGEFNFDFSEVNSVF